MRKVVVGLLSTALVSSVGVTIPVAGAEAAPNRIPLVATTPATAQDRLTTDELPNPLEEKRRELRARAVADVVSGRTKVERRSGSTVVNLGKVYGTGPTGRRLSKSGQNQYVELSREKTDKIFVVLAEFGNERHPDFPDQDTDPATDGPATFNGPLHNQIPQPNRSVDNSTNWLPNYSPAHYRQLYFGTGKNVESLKTYYETQSSGRYSVDGMVTDWVKVRYNEARYGRSTDDPNDANGDDPNVCASHNCPNVWELIRDAANQWVANQKAAGRTDAQIARTLKSFDQQDRYDHDGDGNFNEPDGYLDHFQIVHAGGDEADSDPQQGEDAVWSHRWYAFATDQGRTGPTGNRLGGTQIGESGLWIGDYTIQPENGGLSVFAHEYGHDLGLPDDYDTSGLGQNNTTWWTLMSQSRLSAPGDPGADTRAGDLGAWNKLQLGWLDYETVLAKKKKTLDLGPQEYNTKKAQAVVVVLPKKSVTTQLGEPYAGDNQYFSGNDDQLDTTMTRQFDLTGRATASLTLKTRYSIEKDYDYLYVEGSTDGTTWTALNGTVNGAPFGRDASGTPALTGSTGDAWVDMAVPLTAYAGKKLTLRFHYRTDSGVSEGGFFADDITIAADNTTLLTDGAEGTTTWALKGFKAVGSSSTGLYDNFYIAGYRSHVSYDRYLKTGPYTRPDPAARPNWLQHYPYQEGLLISYWDTSQKDNNTNEHPGQGLNLLIDSRPEPRYNLEGKPWSVYLQMYDAPFSLKKADSFTLGVNGRPNYVRGQAAVPTFDDRRTYMYDPVKPWGVQLPAVGVKIKILKQKGTSMRIKLS